METDNMKTILVGLMAALVLTTSTSVPATAHTSTGNPCITTTIDGTPLAKPICDFPALVGGFSPTNCPAVIPATFTASCFDNALNKQVVYVNGVQV